MLSNGELHDRRLIGQVHTPGCALIELDNDSLAGRDAYIRKICDIGKCSFEGFNDGEGLTSQISLFDCYRANNGLQDEDHTDEDLVYSIGFD